MDTLTNVANILALFVWDWCQHEIDKEFIHVVEGSRNPRKWTWKRQCPKYQKKKNKKKTRQPNQRHVKYRVKPVFCTSLPSARDYLVERDKKKKDFSFELRAKIFRIFLLASIALSRSLVIISSNRKNSRVSAISHLRNTWQCLKS